MGLGTDAELATVKRHEALDGVPALSNARANGSLPNPEKEA
ncbi:hypothetical protein [Planktothricoides sp. SR001]|nr:hypothetical protein [Planktothricoides sp. SR001]